MRPIVAFTLFASLLTAACGSEDAPDLGTEEQPVWTNGGFETTAIGSPPDGWTVLPRLNNGITDLRPNTQTLASLNLVAGGTAMTAVVGGAAESQTDPDIGAGGTLRFPKYGTRAARLNYLNASSPGSNRNSNSITQTMTIGPGDVDPADGRVHVRFVVAPVLENPGHAYTEQPYYYVRLRNSTTGQVVYEDFNASGQPGVPWKSFTSSTGSAAQYTDWQLADISPASGALAIGDQIELQVVASGCSLGGHWGRVYVDAFGATIPGIYTWATGPQQANAGSDVTYTVNYRNGGTAPSDGTKLDFVTPPNTTFQAVSLGAACTTPSVGQTGTVSCSLGSLPAGATDSFTVTVRIPSGTATGTTITNGNYAISATGVSPLLGPKVQTRVTALVSYADLGVTISDGAAAVGWGQHLTYTIVVRNAGPSATTATVVDTMPAQLTNVSWTCSGSGGGLCTAAGTGSIHDGVTLPSGSRVTYTVQADVVAGSGSGSIVHKVTVTPGTGVTDPNSIDNTAVDIDSVGTLRTLSLMRNGYAHGGTITSVPTAIDCGLGCASATAQFIDGAQVVLTVAPVAGSQFLGWGGACSGTATSCTVTMAGDQSVTTSFVGPAASVTASSGGAQAALTNTAFAQPLIVVVTDVAGSPVPGVVVTFGVPGSGASAALSSTSAITSAAGTVGITATANGVAGTYDVTAAVAGVASAPTFALTNIGPAASITAIGGGGQQAVVGAPFADPLGVVVRDALGTPRPGAPVTFTVPGSGATATLTPLTGTTNASGELWVNATAGTVAGGYSVTAATPGVATPASLGLTNLPGAPHSVAISGPYDDAATAGTAFTGTFAVIVRDPYGNPVPDAIVTFTAPTTGATVAITGSPATTGGDGSATVTAVAGTVAGSYDVVAAIAGGASVAFHVRNTAGAPATLALVSGGGQAAVVTAGFAQPLVFEVRDQHANPVPDVDVALAAPSSGATAGVAPSATTGADGRIATSVTAGTVAGDYQVTASIGALTAAAPLRNLAGAAATIGVVSGDEQVVEVATPVAAPLVAVVRDAYGNPVAGAAVVVEAPLSGAGAAVAPLATTSDADGEITLTATAGETAGAYVVAAVLSETARAEFHLTNRPGAPHAVTASLASTPQSTVVHHEFAVALEVIVTDRFGNLTPGVEVAFGGPPTTGVPAAGFAPTDATTDGDGRARTTATANGVAGDHVAHATVAGVSAPAAFALRNLAGPPATITATGGTPQSSEVDTDFGDRLRVLVLDAEAHPVPGAVVRFAAPTSDATAVLEASTVATGDDGLVAIGARAGTITGSYQVAATIEGGEAPAIFALANTPGAAHAIVANPLSTPQQTRVLTAFAPLVAQVTDRFDNPVPGVAVTYQAPETGATGAPRRATVTSDDDGRTAVAFTAGPVAGAYQVTATVDGVATPAVFALTNLHGEAHRVIAESGGGQRTVVDQAFAAALVARVEDEHGNPVAGATVTFTPPDADVTAIVETTTAVTGSDGRASTAVTAGIRRGSYQVVATATLAATPASFALTNDADVPAAIAALASATPQTTQVEHAFAERLAVEVVDRFGNPVSGALVRYAGPGDGARAVLDLDQALTGDDGVAAVRAVAGAIAGSYQVEARVAGVEPAVAFDLSQLAGPPAHILIDAGGGQRALATTTYAEPVVFRVLDDHGNAVEGASINIVTPAQGATVTMAPGHRVTEADGRVAVTFTAGAALGEVDVMAITAGAMTPAIARLTVDAIPTTAVATAQPATSVDQVALVHVTVAAEVGKPAGDVEVLAGGVVVGRGTLADGAAEIEVRFDARGEHTLVARFPAQGSYGEGVSPPVTVDVTDDEGRLSGGGCSAAGDGGGAALALVLAIAALAMRRRRAAVAVAATAAMAGLASSSPAEAQPAGVRAVERFHAASADSEWFALDSLRFGGDWNTAMAVTWDYAHQPLVIYNADGSRRAVVIEDAVAFQAGVSLTLRERFRLTGTAPMSVYQDGRDGTFNGMMLASPTFAFGDVRLAGDVRVLGSDRSPVRAALGLQVTLPTGSRSNFTSDGEAALEPRAAVAARHGRLELAGETSAFLRRSTELAGLRMGSELRYAAAAGVRLASSRLLLGPELMGATPLSGASSTGHPLELGVGAHYQVTPSLRLGLGATVGIVNAVGTPEERVFLSAAWSGDRI